MPRPARIQYEHAFYHVMNRGKGRQSIFHGDDYYEAFLQTLEEAYQRFDALIHSYCLMGNHYHLLIETPRANLDRIMRHINGVYTQRYNRRKRTDGPLFRGRYKAILVDEDAYLLQVGRYIHRNPVEAKGAASDILVTYPWSSYLAYINQAKAPVWLIREKTYQMLGHRQPYAGYRAYVEAGNSEEFKQFYNKGNMAAILGSKEFKEGIFNKQEELQVSGDLAQALSERPDAEAVVQAVAAVFQVNQVDIVTRKQGRQVGNMARIMAIYCCQQLGDLPLTEIAEHFGLSHPGSVSPAVNHIRRKLASGELVSQLQSIEKVLNIIK